MQLHRVTDFSLFWEMFHIFQSILSVVQKEGREEQDKI